MHSARQAKPSHLHLEIGFLLNTEGPSVTCMLGLNPSTQRCEKPSNIYHYNQATKGLPVKTGMPSSTLSLPVGTCWVMTSALFGTLTFLGLSTLEDSYKFGAITIVSIPFLG